MELRPLTIGALSASLALSTLVVASLVYAHGKHDEIRDGCLHGCHHERLQCLHGCEVAPSEHHCVLSCEFKDQECRERCEA